MRARVRKELERRPAHALGAPEGYEDRAVDLAIEALDDIAECDGAVMYIKWDRLFVAVAPLLYILFDGSCPSLRDVPRVHMHPHTGAMHPAHAICLCSMPSRRLFEGQELKDVVRRGIEDFLRRHNVQPSKMVGVVARENCYLCRAPATRVDAQGRYICEVPQEAHIGTALLTTPRPS